MTKLTIVLSLLLYASGAASGSFMKPVLPKVSVARYNAMGCSVRSCVPHHDARR